MPALCQATYNKFNPSDEVWKVTILFVKYIYHGKPFKYWRFVFHLHQVLAMKKIAVKTSQREEKILMSFFKNQVEHMTDEVFL